MQSLQGLGAEYEEVEDEEGAFIVGCGEPADRGHNLGCDLAWIRRRSRHGRFYADTDAVANDDANADADTDDADTAATPRVGDPGGRDPRFA